MTGRLPAGGTCAGQGVGPAQRVRQPEGTGHPADQASSLGGRHTGSGDEQGPGGTSAQYRENRIPGNHGGRTRAAGARIVDVHRRERAWAAAGYPHLDRMTQSAT